MTERFVLTPWEARRYYAMLFAILGFPVIGALGSFLIRTALHRPLFPTWAEMDYWALVASLAYLGVWIWFFWHVPLEMHVEGDTVSMRNFIATRRWPLRAITQIVRTSSEPLIRDDRWRWGNVVMKLSGGFVALPFRFARFEAFIDLVAAQNPQLEVKGFEPAWDGTPAAYHDTATTFRIKRRALIRHALGGLFKVCMGIVFLVMIPILTWQAGSTSPAQVNILLYLCMPVFMALIVAMILSSSRHFRRYLTCPFAITIHPDGAVVFHGLLRRWRTHGESIRSLSLLQDDKRVWIAITYDGTSNMRRVVLPYTLLAHPSDFIGTLRAITPGLEVAGV